MKSMGTRENNQMEPSEIEKQVLERMVQAKAEQNVSVPWMVLRFARLLLYRAIKGRWHLPAIGEISVDELHERVNSDPAPLLLDLRSEAEFSGGFGHIPNSRLVPMFNLEASLTDLQPFKEMEVVTICPGGGMSLVAAEIMAKAGFQDVKSLKGGVDGWFKKGYPTTTSRST